MLTIRKCMNCGKEFDAQVGTAEKVCFACRDVPEDGESGGKHERRREPRNRRGETWEEQAQRMTHNDKMKDSSIDNALRSCGGVHVKRKHI